MGPTTGLKRGEKVPVPGFAAEPTAGAVTKVDASPVVLVPSVEELQADLAARDARIAELEVLLTNARAGSTSMATVQVPGSVTLRIEVLS